VLEGIKIKQLQRRPDERGSFTEIIREDWEDILGEKFLQANLSITFPGIIRAWHRHNRGQNDYFIALNGAIKICAYDDETKELSEIISMGQNPQIVRVPGKYWHGFKALGTEQAWLLYFVNELYDYTNPDEERRPWNDPNLIPTTINGRTDDPRAGKPWDWNYPPHK
jgi:dTDP-4-dehydrorhamnose 3,5-epimerase